MKIPTRPQSTYASEKSILRWLAYSLGYPPEVYNNIFAKNMGMGWMSQISWEGMFVGSIKLHRAWRVIDTPLGILFEEVPMGIAWPRMTETAYPHSPT